MLEGPASIEHECKNFSIVPGKPVKADKVDNDDRDSEDSDSHSDSDSKAADWNSEDTHRDSDPDSKAADRNSEETHPDYNSDSKAADRDSEDTRPDSNSDSKAADREFEALEWDIVYRWVGIQKRRKIIEKAQAHGKELVAQAHFFSKQEEVHSWEQIREQSNSYHPSESMEVAGTRTISDHLELPENTSRSTWQAKAERRTEAQILREYRQAERRTEARILRENRQFQDQHVLMELCKAAQEVTDEATETKFETLGWCKLKRKSLPYSPIRQDPEYERAVRKVQRQHVLPRWVEETATWSKRQTLWAERVEQGDACEGLLYQERMDAEAEAQARWEMRNGVLLSFEEKTKAYKEIRKRRKAAEDAMISSMKAKSTSHHETAKTYEALQQYEGKQSATEDQWSTTGLSLSDMEKFRREWHEEIASRPGNEAVQQAARHYSISTVQSSTTWSVFEKQQSTPSQGQSSPTSSVSGEQKSTLEEHLSMLEQNFERTTSRAAQDRPMVVKSLSPVGKSNAKKPAHQAEAPASVPEPRRLSKRAYVEDVEDENWRSNQESPTKRRGRVDSVASKRASNQDQDQNTEMKDV